MWQVLRSLAEGCGLDEGARSLGLGLQEQQHSSCAQNGALQPRERMDGATPQYEQLQVPLALTQEPKTACLCCPCGPPNLPSHALPCSVSFIWSKSEARQCKCL